MPRVATPTMMRRSDATGGGSGSVLRRRSAPGGGAADELAALELVRVGTARAGRGRPEVAPTLLRPGVQARVPALAALHRVGGSVLCGLDGVGGVSDELTGSLAEQRRLWDANHLVMLRSIRELAHELDDRGLRWMAFKGPVLATEVYRHPGDRAYGDVDLLVHPRDLGPAVRVLESLGYAHANHHWRHAEWLLRSEFSMERGDTLMDVHWHVQYAGHERADLRLDLDALHARSRRIDVGGFQLAAPSPEDSLLLTAYHACRSGGHRLIWAKDIERLLACGGVDRELFLELVARGNVGGQVAVAIARSMRLLEFDERSLLDELGCSRLLRVERAVTRRSSPLRVDERETVARRWARSVRGTLGDTIRYVGRRAWRRTVGRDRTAPSSILDDEQEKQAYFDRVAQEA